MRFTETILGKVIVVISGSVRWELEFWDSGESMTHALIGLGLFSGEMAVFSVCELKPNRNVCPLAECMVISSDSPLFSSPSPPGCFTARPETLGPPQILALGLLGETLLLQLGQTQNPSF